MPKKEKTYRGKSIEELQDLSLKEVAALLPARARRSLNRGFTDAEKALMKKVRSEQDNIRTHCREMVIIPAMVGKTIHVHCGNSFEPVKITIEMIGHRLGEMALTRKRVTHNAPGVGATRSSAFQSVR